MPIWIQLPILPNVLPPGNLDEDDLDLEIPEVVDEDPECTCTLDALICRGCQCGAMQKERNSKPN